MTASERAAALPDREHPPAREAPTGDSGSSGDSGPRATERLRRSRDFEAAMRHGRRTRDPMLHLTARRNELPYTRVGYAVSRRVGGAVVRNRVKRRLREIIRSLSFQPGYDIVAVPQHSSANASFQELSAATGTCARRLKVLAGENDRQL